MSVQSGERPPPRIAMLGTTWFPTDPGGLERYFRELYESLPAETTSGAVLGPAADPPPRLQIASDRGKPLPVRLFSFWRAANRAAREADMVDSHFALYALLPRAIGRARRLPWVVHFQGPWASEAVSQGEGARWKYALRRALESYVYRRADRIVVLSSAFREVVVERYGVSPSVVEVIAPGSDVERFNPGSRSSARACFEIPDGAFVAGCVRRLVPRMGLEILLAAWAQVVAQLPSGSLLLIAGQGDLRGELEALIDELGIETSTRLLGRIDEEALVDLYRAADVCVVPTLEHEGYGLVVTEAAACGTPSIVTDVGGLPEAVADLDPTLVVEPGNAAALASRIVSAAVHGALPDRDSTREYSHGFRWSEIARKHLRLYDQIRSGAAHQ